jgi:hypothetical protein
MTTTKQTIAYATRLPTACSWVSRGMLLRMLRSMPVHVLGLASVLRHGDVNPGHQGRAWRELRAQGHRDGALYPSGFCISAVWRVGYIVRRLRELGSRVSKTKAAKILRDLFFLSRQALPPLLVAQSNQSARAPGWFRGCGARDAGKAG